MFLSVVAGILSVLATGATLPQTDGQSPAASHSPVAVVQLPYGTASREELRLPADLAGLPGAALPAAIPGRQTPPLTPLAQLASAPLAQLAIPLPKANTLSHVNFQQGRFGRLQVAGGRIVLFNPEMVLVKLRGFPQVRALRVEPMREYEAVQTLRRRSDVEFAELDTFEQRQFTPDDPLLQEQWHHGVIGSYQAWNYGLGQSFIQIAIVDTPFQMDHPDLAANTVDGWDAVANVPVTNGTGIVHSTMCAGMAAALVNNAIGVAGAANCQVLPININGAISEMYNAVVWAADHGVRVVNISWSGANSDTLEAAGSYLRTQARGALVMSAIDGAGYLDWTNQPDIYCVSMTDDADNFEDTMYGPYIDFAAPGYEIYSTTTGGSYAYGTGTSYAAPLFSGVVAWLFGLNPTLGPSDVIAILQGTAVQLGSPGWNPYFGWGRIDFGAAASAAMAMLPKIQSIQFSNQQVTVSVNYVPGLVYTLWRTADLSSPIWARVTNAVVQTNASLLILQDAQAPEGKAFYRLEAALP